MTTGKLPLLIDLRDDQHPGFTRAAIRADYKPHDLMFNQSWFNPDNNPKKQYTNKPWHTESRFRTAPPIPPFINVDANSLKMYLQANDNVAFTGVCDFSSAMIFLAPLDSVEERGNATMNAINADEHHAYAGSLDGKSIPKSVFHPNLSQRARQGQHQTSGHTKACLLYGLNEDNCVGFAITKGSIKYLFGRERAGDHMTITSRTLNSSKFLGFSPTARLQLKHTLGNGTLSLQWTIAIVAALQRAAGFPLGPCNEAPF